MAAYWAAKRLLFGWPGLRAAVVNIDDEQGATLADELEAAFAQRGGPAVWTYSTRAPARAAGAATCAIWPTAWRSTSSSATPRCRCAARWSAHYNVSNLLAVVGALRALGIGLADAARVLPQLSPVPGRMQRVGGGRRALAGGGGRLCAHPRRAGAGAAGAAPAGACARRQAVVRVRLRRQPRRHQAPADGRASRTDWPITWCSPATTRATKSPALILSQILAGIQGDDTRRRDRGPPRRDPRRGGARRARRRRAAGRQGPRRDAGRRRREAAVQRCRRGARRRWRARRSAAEAAEGHDDAGASPRTGARLRAGR